MVSMHTILSVYNREATVDVVQLLRSRTKPFLTSPLVALQPSLGLVPEALRVLSHLSHELHGLLEPLEEVQLLHRVEDGLDLLLRGVPQREGDVLPYLPTQSASLA